MELALELLRKRLVLEQENLDEKTKHIANLEFTISNAYAIRLVYQKSVDSLQEAINVLEGYENEHRLHQ